MVKCRGEKEYEPCEKNLEMISEDFLDSLTSDVTYALV